MRYITAAAALALFALAVVLLAVSLTPATVIAAMVMLGAAGMSASFALFVEADDAPADAADAGDLLIPNDTTTADIDGTAHLLNMMEATAATIDPTDPNLFVYRPALNGGTRWAATLHDTYNDVITTVTGSTQNPGTVNVINVYKDTGTTDCFKNVNALHAAWELEADLPNIIPV